MLIISSLFVFLADAVDVIFRMQEKRGRFQRPNFVRTFFIGCIVLPTSTRTNATSTSTRLTVRWKCTNPFLLSFDRIKLTKEQIWTRSGSQGRYGLRPPPTKTLPWKYRTSSARFSSSKIRQPATAGRIGLSRCRCRISAAAFFLFKDEFRTIGSSWATWPNLIISAWTVW